MAESGAGMKVLFITRRVDRDDARAGFVIRWIEELAHSVEELHVMCLEVGDTAGLPSNCSVYSLGKERGKSRIREFFRFHALAAQLVPRVDGILTHQNPEYGILVAPWAKIFRKQLIAWYVHKAVTWKVRLLHFLVDRVVTASPESFRIQSRKVTILHHGVDTFLFRPAATSPVGTQKQLLSVSRVSPSKRIDVMVRLVSELVAHGIDVRLNIVGSPAIPSDAEYKRSLDKLIKDLGVSSRVVFVGPVLYRDTISYYQTADLFLNFSDTGSIDKAVLEAMSCGTPVLTSNEAFRDILNSIHQDLYSDRTDVDTLAARVENLLAHSAKVTWGGTLRDYAVTHHDLRILTRRIVSLYG